MVDLLKLETKRCYRCSFGIQMPDGRAWCGITSKPESGINCSYSSGTVKIYKPESKVMTPKQEARKIKVREIKPIPTKQKPISSSKKIPSPQQKMF